MTWSIGLATGVCTERPIDEILGVLHRGGARAVEIGTPPRHFDLWKDAQVSAVEERLRALAITPVSIHAPFGHSLDLADSSPQHRRAGIAGVEAAARTIKRLGGRIVVVHPSDLARHGADVGAHLAHSVASLRALSVSCREQGVTLAIESPLPHLIGGHPDEFETILRGVGDGAGVCLDTGHIALGRSWRRFMAIFQGRLVHVHASDNHGDYDDHLPPGDGIIDWREIATTLRDAQFTGWMMLELRCPGSDLAEYVHRALERAEALMAAK